VVSIYRVAGVGSSSGKSNSHAFCVWELGAVIHEQKAWTEYLYSARNEEARLAWIGDRFRGVV
jgi:hypothetical protein